MAKEETYNIEISENLTVTLTAEDIDDIMSAALDGDITPMWCRRVESVSAEPCNDSGMPVSVRKDGYTGEHLTKGNKLLFELIDGDDMGDGENGPYSMTIYDFKEGFRLWFLENMDKLDEYGRIDWTRMDAVQADIIVQYALFGEYVFG